MKPSEPLPWKSRLAVSQVRRRARRAVPEPARTGKPNKYEHDGQRYLEIRSRTVADLIEELK